MTDTAALDAPAMRLAFDQAFSLPLDTDERPWEDFLLIRLNQHPHALRLSEIRGLRTAGWITPVPGAPPELLGLSGHQGGILPVYDLAAMLGWPGTARGRWQVATRDPQLMLSFEHFDRHVRCPFDAIAPTRGDSAGAHGHIAAQLQTDAGHCPVISIPAVLATIQNKARVARQES